MTRPLAAVLAVFLVPFVPLPLLAQVGFPPDQSPYRDLEYRQELTPMVGYFIAAKDPAGVAPRSGPMLGLRYEVRVGGPAQLTVRAARVFSERAPLDPRLPEATRRLAAEGWPIYMGDLGIAVNLTGQKSIRHFVPVLNGGIGVVSDFRGADAGGYEFGTSFAFLFGAGVRWVPGGRFQLRADLTDHLYQIKYPDAYLLSNNGTPPILAGARARDFWRHNAALTVGASYLFFR